MILEGAYRDVSSLSFFFPQKSLILGTNHHFDLVFFTNEFEKDKKIVLKLIKKYNGLRYYEKFPPFE